MTREPIVAGQFYEASFGKLDRQIEGCFDGTFGPGCTPGKRKDKRILGIISPHAGYPFSGQCAAWGFKEIGESRIPDTFILLGLSHQGYKSAISSDDWATPFGPVRNNKALGEVISKVSGIPIMDQPHRTEHSIEVQLPFLQFVCKDMLSRLRIIPIIISGDVDPYLAGKRIREACQGKECLFIASSDFTHYGPHYGYVPFTDDKKEKLRELDQGAITKIIAKDAQGFLDYTKKTGATICGRHPIVALMGALPEPSPKLLSYYTSGDILGDHENAVGYASILFR